MNSSLDKVIISNHDLSLAEEEPLEFDISLSKEDLEPVPNVKKINYLSGEILSIPSDDDSFIASLKLHGEVIIINNISKEEEVLPIETEDYLNLSEDKDECDVMPHNGLYDFMPAIKAIFYWAIPKMEEEEYLKDGEGYEVITEEELKKRKADGDVQENPFKIAFAQKKKKK